MAQCKPDNPTDGDCKKSHLANDHLRTEALQQNGANAINMEKVLYPLIRPIVLPVCNDTLSKYWPYAFQRIQLASRGNIDIQRLMREGYSR